ncbi:phage holin family protein [Rhodobacter sp. SY28-1]|uniref:phage holin family protein n=1 Tax=Rhodobacter sp. SY28-1 TaxID=2562317 RepID=UPI0010C107CA|nr:phage holin family protein [Rhodobacter sp. SY28-1]
MRDPAAEHDPALTGLFAEVLSGVGRLVRGELRLARAEATDSLRSVGSGLVKLAGAAVVALVGLNVLAGAAVGALAHAGLGPVWAALVVGLGLTLLALVLALAGRSALLLRGRKPRRFLDGLRSDARAVKAGLKMADPNLAHPNLEGTHHV